MKKFIFAFLLLLVCAGANSAQLVGSEILLCDNGYSPDNTTCTTYGTGVCDSGYYDTTPSSASFYAATNGLCTNSISYGGSYHAQSLPDTTIAIIYQGTLVGSEITLCTNGYSPDNTTCTTYDVGDCPTGYYGVNAGTTSFAVKDGSCTSGYHEYTAEDSCGFEPQGSTCISFCSDGLYTTGVGGCSELCGEGATTFRTSTGLKYPLWATKQITPSLNIGFENGNRCYMNLTSEPATGQTVWFQWENNKLHATK